MDGSNRPAIDDICDTLGEVRDRASREGYGLLVHLINEAIEEAENIKSSISVVYESASSPRS